jgi:hypothetical protein
MKARNGAFDADATVKISDLFTKPPAFRSACRFIAPKRRRNAADSTA